MTGFSCKAGCVFHEGEDAAPSIPEARMAFKESENGDETGHEFVLSGET
jgi:hypothetical protein